MRDVAAAHCRWSATQFALDMVAIVYPLPTACCHCPLHVFGVVLCYIYVEENHTLPSASGCVAAVPQPMNIHQVLVLMPGLVDHSCR